jgi:PAS domain S-box-containing protein
MDADVLLVDPGVKRDAGDRLREAGATVETVTTVGAGLARLDRDLDCVVVVHRPPALDGIAFVERADEARPDVATVLLPIDGSESLAARAVAAGADRYVVDGDLIDVVESLATGVTEETVETADVTVPEAATLETATTATTEGGSTTASSRGFTPVPDGLDGVEEVGFDLKERAMDEAPVGITISDPDLPDNPLIYVNDAFERMTGYTPEDVLGTNCRFLQGEDTDPAAVQRIREAIEVDEPVSVELVNYRKDGEKFWNQLDIAPLRNEDGEVTNYVGFQMDITDRKRAEFAVERYAEQLDRERAALDRVLDRVNGLVEDVAGALVQASRQAEIERRVCELVGNTDPYVGAWIGRLDLPSDAIEVTATAGLTGDLVGTSIPLDGSEDPAVAAVQSGDLRAGSPVGSVSGVHGRVTEDANAVAAIPLSYRDTRYGVLSVYAPADAMDDRERSMLGSLGRMVATGINAVETKEILTAENVVSLEFSVRDRDLFFVDLSAVLSCSLTHAGSVWQDDGSLLTFFTVAGADSDRVREAVADLPGVERASIITEADDAALVEFVTREASILTELADYGARTRELSATEGEGRIRVEVSHDSTARSVVSHVTEEYEGAELRSYRERQRPPTTKGEFLAETRDRLTERQLTALQKAHVSGYFEWPRRTDGNALADSMGISRSTFHQHLRAAHRKLVSELFADLDPTS